MIDGQKVWQTRAREANWIFTLVRTDPEASKHHGLTFLLVPMDQPAIEVRPIRMIGGSPDFNAVFFDGARTSKANVVGEVNGGWAVANSVLGLERGDEAATNPVLFRAEFDRLVAMAGRARAPRRSGDPRPHRRRLRARVETMRFLGYRILTGVLSTGVIGPEASISKLYWSEYHRDVTRLAIDVLGAGATGRRGPAADARVPRRRPRRAQLDGVVGRRAVQRRGRHHLRRDVGGAAQHPRRARARAAACDLLGDPTPVEPASAEPNSHSI